MTQSQDPGEPALVARSAVGGQDGEEPGRGFGRRGPARQARQRPFRLCGAGGKGAGEGGGAGQEADHVLPRDRARKAAAVHLVGRQRLQHRDPLGGVERLALGCAVRGSWSMRIEQHADGEVAALHRAAEPQEGIARVVVHRAQEQAGDALQAADDLAQVGIPPLGSGGAGAEARPDAGR